MDPESSLASANNTIIEPAGVFRFAKGAGVALAGRLFGRGFGFIGQVILARILQPELFGLYAIGWTILRLATVIAPLGLDNGVIRFGSKYYWQRDYPHLRGIFSLSLGSALLSGVIFSFVLYLTSPWLAINFFRKPELELILKGFALAVPLTTSLRVMVAGSSVTQKMLCGGVAEDIAQPAIQIFLFLLTWRWIGGIQAALIATILSFMVSVGFGRLCIIRLMPEALSPAKVAWGDSTPLIRFSLISMVAVSFGILNLWGNRLVIGYFRPEAEVGIFQSVSLIATFTVIILSGIKAIMAPMAAELYQAGEIHQLDSLVKVVSKWVLYLSLPLLLAVIVVPQEILVFAFGESYKSGAAPMVVLMLSQIFYMAFGISDQLLLMSGHHMDWLIISAVTFFFNLALNIMVVPAFGMLGAAWVSMVSSLVILLWGGFQVRRRLSILPYDSRHIKPLVAALLSAIPLFLVAEVSINSQFLKMTIIVLTAIIAFGGAILLLGLDKEDRSILQTVMRKLTKGDTSDENGKDIISR